jgi:phospholipase C
VFPRPFLVVLLLVLSSLILGLTACGGNASGASTSASSQSANGLTITLTATPTTVTAGQFTTLQWTTTGATSVSISPAIPAEDKQPLAVSGNAPVVPTATTTYTATATAPSGATASASVTVTINRSSPTLTCSASPASIIARQTSTLRCLSQNATSVTVDNGVGPLTVPTGTVTVSPLATTVFTATATGPGGTTTTTATVTVQQQLAVTLAATPNLIAPGQSSTLTWQSQQAVAVTIQPAIGAVALNGSVSVNPTATTTYTATATDAAGHTTTALANLSVISNNASLNNIKHIIFFLQENRSFDNYFGQLGAYKASKGFANDIDGLPANAVQLDSQKVAVHPYHLQTVCVENMSPSWNPSWGAYNLDNFTLQPGPGVNGNILVGGTPGMNGFVNDKDQPTALDPEYHRVMGYYDETDLPYYYEAATQFATSDRWFSPLMSATIPNRMYLFTGTSFGHIAPDPPPLGGFTQETIFQLLNSFGVSWAYYFQDTSIMLGQWNVWGDQVLINSHVFPLANWFSTLSSPNADTDLPSVVFIERAGEIGLDEHPSNNIQAGAARAAQIINALLASPAWQSSVLILSYDEFGGAFDHVPPISLPAPDTIAPILSPQFAPFLAGDFAHSGFRVPLIVFSPWVKPHFVSHTPRDLTSILKLIETRFGLPSLTARDAAADDMTEFFDFTTPAWLTPPPLPPQPTNGVCDFSKELAGQQ